MTQLSNKVIWEESKKVEHHTLSTIFCAIPSLDFLLSVPYAISYIPLEHINTPTMFVLIML